MKIFFEKKDLIGTKVIARSNVYDEPYKVGTFIGYDIHQMPLVESNGVEYHVGGVIVPYTEQMVKALDGMTGKEQYEWCVNLRNFIRIL